MHQEAEAVVLYSISESLVSYQHAWNLVSLVPLVPLVPLVSE